MKTTTTPPSAAARIRPPSEQVYATELATLQSSDTGPRPPGWRLSPRAVRTFILGSNDDPVEDRRGGKGTVITRKFHGDDPLVDRCIVTLLGQRGLLLVGEPGTAKSMLSELLAAATCGDSTLTIQGTAGTTDDQVKYSWNYALLLAEGPSQRALVPSPLLRAMRSGSMVRFEEITRCQPEIQDTLVSILSEKVLHIPELPGEDGMAFAARGFNLIATANLRDRGVHEMSSALKRRFNFETVHPIADRAQELRLVGEQAERLLREAELQVACPEDVMSLLVATFHDLRTGRTEDGIVIEKPTTVMSTAEAVSVAYAAGLDAHYFGEGRMEGAHVARQLAGTLVKDNPDDLKKIRHYFDAVVKHRAKGSRAWQSCWEARRHVGL